MLLMPSLERLSNKYAFFVFIWNKFFSCVLLTNDRVLQGVSGTREISTSYRSSFSLFCQVVFTLLPRPGWVRASKALLKTISCSLPAFTFSSKRSQRLCLGIKCCPPLICRWNWNSISTLIGVWCSNRIMEFFSMLESIGKWIACRATKLVWSPKFSSHFGKNWSSWTHRVSNTPCAAF